MPISRNVIARSSLPVLTLAASYGVYSFSSHFSKWTFFDVNVVAAITAGAFELVYIGLAVINNLTDLQRKKAQYISIGAVIVSVLFNWVAGILDTTGAKFETLWFPIQVILAGLHGVPLATLAFLVANLLLHSDAGKSVVDRLQEFEKKSNDLEEKNKDLAATVEMISKNNDDFVATNNRLLEDKKKMQHEFDLLNRNYTASLNEVEQYRKKLLFLQNAGQPFEFANGEFRPFEFPAAEIRQLPRPVELLEAFDILAGCLQKRQVTTAASRFEFLEVGAPFGKSDYTNAVKRLLEAE